MKTAEEILEKWIGKTAYVMDKKYRQLFGEKEKLIKAMEEYAQERTKDMYPKEFVEWIAYNYIIEDFNTLNDPFEPNGTLDELFTYWKEQIKK